MVKKVNFTLAQATKTQTGEDVQLYSFFILGGGARVQKISPPPGFDLRTVEPVESRYTD
jgi:hypothetical protein